MVPICFTNMLKLRLKKSTPFDKNKYYQKKYDVYSFTVIFALYLNRSSDEKERGA